MLSNVRLDKLYLHHLKSNTFFATCTQRPNEIKTAACAFVRVFVFWWQTSCRRWAVWIERQWDLKEMRTHSNNVLDDSITFSYRNVSFVFLWIALLRKCHANRLFVHFKTPFTLSSRSPLAASSLAMAAVKLRIPVCIRSMVMVMLLPLHMSLDDLIWVCVCARCVRCNQLRADGNGNTCQLHKIRWIESPWHTNAGHLNRTAIENGVEPGAVSENWIFNWNEYCASV